MHVVSKAPKTNDSYKQALLMLVDEAKKIEAATGINISEADLDKQVDAFAKERGMTFLEFKELMTKEGVNIRTLYNRFKALITWSNLIEATAPKYEPTEQQIEEEISKANSDSLKTFYNLSEIVCSSMESANRVIGLLKTQPFQLIAVQNSISSSAIRGGDIGWFPVDSLDVGAQNALKQMNPGEYTRPMQYGKVFKIFFLKDIESKDHLSLSRTIVSITHVVIPNSEDLESSQKIAKIFLDLKGLNSNDAIKKAKELGLQIYEEKNISGIRMVEAGKLQLLKNKSEVSDVDGAKILSFVTENKVLPKINPTRQQIIASLRQKEIGKHAFVIERRIGDLLSVEYKSGFEQDSPNLIELKNG